MKIIKTIKWGYCLGLLVLIATTQSWAQDSKLKISGFSNITFSSAFGDAASEEQRARHLLNGGDPEITREGTDFSFPGLNLFLNSQLSDQLTFQSEVRFEVKKNDLSTSIEQTYLKYAFSEKFNLTTGLFITPLGYLARNQRDLDYLNYSFKVRDMINEDFGFTPFQTLGFQINGTFEAGSSAIRYWLAYGGSRNITPTGFIFETQFGDDKHSSASLTANLEYYKPMDNGELILGFGLTSSPRIGSYYIATAGGVAQIETDPLIGATEMELSEIIIAPYVKYDADKFQIFIEYHKNTLTDELGNTANKTYSFDTFSGQLLYKTKIKEKSVYPYVRYDRVDFSNDDPGPYYGLVSVEDDVLMRTHTANREQIMFGMALDLFSSNRIKIEYAYFLNGPEPQNGINIATAFAF